MSMTDTAPIYESLGRKLRALREARGLSQKELGEALGGRSQMNVSQFESGARKIDLDTLARAAEFFGVGLRALLDDAWRVSRHPGPNGESTPALVIDGLDLAQAFDQYLAETPFEDLRNTEEVRLKALLEPEGCPRAMLQLARNPRLWYGCSPTPKEWHFLEQRVALRRGGYRGVDDVLSALEHLRSLDD